MQQTGKQRPPQPSRLWYIPVAMPVVTDDADTQFMREALAEARRAEAQGEVPVGAIVVREGEILWREPTG